VVGVRWERLEWALVAWYCARAVAPWQLWRACGSPEQFRPVFRWWLLPLRLVLAFFGWWPVVPGRPVRRAGVSVRGARFEQLAWLVSRRVSGSASESELQQLAALASRIERFR
jgi:hypothetical protein